MARKKVVPSRKRWPTKKQRLKSKMKLPDIFSGEVPTEEQLKELIRFIEFKREHDRLERARKRGKRKRIWPRKPKR